MLLPSQFLSNAEISLLKIQNPQPFKTRAKASGCELSETQLNPPAALFQTAPSGSRGPSKITGVMNNAFIFVENYEYMNH